MKSNSNNTSAIPPVTQENRSDTSLPVAVTLEAARISTIGMGVSTALFPMDVWLQRSQTCSASPTAPKLSLGAAQRFGSPRSLLKGYSASSKGSVLKNGVLAQRERTDEAFRSEELRSEESTSHEQDGLGVESNSILRSAGVAAALGTVDTTLGQYHRNWRTMYVHQSTHPGFSVPQLKSIRERFNFFKIGYFPRVTSSVAGIGGFIATTHLTPYFATILPDPTHANIAATLTTASTAGTLTNALHVLYNNQVTRTSPSSITAPSLSIITNDLLASHGFKVFFRGSNIAIMYTGTAYFIVPHMEKIADKFVLPAIDSRLTKTSVSAKSHWLFKRSTNDTHKKEAIIDKAKMYFSP